VNPPMDSYKLALKLFIEDDPGIPVERFVPVFHRWIQSAALADHQLIDVADYKHVHEGPGVVLVSHEANIHADLGGGRLGLLYFRKQPLDGPFRDRLEAVITYTLRAAELLQKDPDLGPQIRIRTDALLLRIHDRLHAPNAPETFEQVRPDLSRFLTALYGAAPELTHRPGIQDLFEVGIRFPQPVPIPALMQRLAEAPA